MAFFEDIESFDLACNSTDPSPTCHCDPLHTTHCYDGQKIKNAYGEIAMLVYPCYVCVCVCDCDVATHLRLLATLNLSGAAVFFNQCM